MQKQHETTELSVIGAGVTLEGVNFYVIPSQAEPGRVHLVRQLATRLSCDCRGYQYRNKCCHVDAVKAHKQRLQLETANAARAPARETHPLQPAAATSAGTASTVDPRDTAILRRSQQPFSILK